MARFCMQDLIDIMARLRGENGCPWDKAQTHESLKPYVLEEAYEVIDAIDRKNREDIIEELGDLLLQIVFHSRLAQERGDFDMGDVIDGICEKMIRRHPHIFGDIKVESAGEVLKNWEDIKREEKDVKTQTQSMKSLPKNLPALMLAFKVQEKAARVGFDWDNVEDAMKKVAEEMEELKEVYKGKNGDKIREEMGDLLFAAVNVARFLEVNPELALREATRKFIRRFDYVEQAAAKLDRNLQEMTLEEMDNLWEEGKKYEKKFYFSCVQEGFSDSMENSPIVKIIKEGNLVNKADLISIMAEKSGLTKKDSEKALNAFVEAVEEALAKRDKVQLVGFGTFEVRERSARKGRNPQTGEEIDIPAASMPAFKAGKALKDSINK